MDSGLRRRALLKGFFLVGCLAFILTFADAARVSAREGETLAARRELVRALQLTDLALFTEARYARHVSQADLHSAFMDHPLAFEHFPSGTLVRPPAHLIETHGSLARKTEVPD